MEKKLNRKIAIGDRHFMVTEQVLGFLKPIMDAPATTDYEKLFVITVAELNGEMVEIS